MSSLSTSKPIDTTLQLARRRPATSSRQDLARAVGHLRACEARRHAEHPRDREAPDVGVEHADRASPRAASAAARLAVTDDLPTPPLPLPTAITRVVAETSVGGACSASACGPAASRSRALFLGHLVVLDATVADAGQARDLRRHVVADLAPQRAGGGGERDLHRDRPSGSTVTPLTMPSLR